MTLPNRTLSDITQQLASYNPDALPVDQAQRIIHDFVTPIHVTEKIALRSALQRVLAEDIVSPIDVPAHNNSAMDGYAFSAKDADLSQAVTLQIVGSAYAGHRYEGAVLHGQCVEIMTGAVMPPECDTVVQQEMVTVSNASIHFPPKSVQLGDNYREKGEDLTKGQPALRKGTVLKPAHLGLLASLGIAEVPVQRRLRVAFFSTGDELRSIGQALDEGSVYDSNRYTLHGMLTRLGCDIIDMGVIQDDPVLLEAALRDASENVDAIITSGGVSVGVADYIKEIMAKLGDVAFWTIGMRPGRPMAFGHITSSGKGAYLFGLPGNPVAVMVTFYFFVRDALLRAMGANVSPLPRMRVRCTSSISKKQGRTEYQRGILSQDENGAWQVQTTGSQGSGILRSMAEANCMIVLEHELKQVLAGDEVSVVLFDGLV